MNFLIVSFCNQLSSPLHSLCAMDLSSGNAQWINLSLIPDEYRESFAGICGVCSAEDQIVIATQGAKPVLAIVDLEAAKISAFASLDKCKDTHSIVFHVGYVYAVSTGTNEIYRVPVQNRMLGVEELYWQYPGVRYDRDEVHLNGLTIDGDRFIASCFGERNKNGSWSTNGKVFYLDTGGKLHGSLLHPHTPLVIGNRLFFAESAANKVYVYNKLKQSIWALDKGIHLGGYTRGLTFRNGRLIVGLSASRKISRSKKSINTEVLQSSDTSVVVVDVEAGLVEKVFDLVKYGREIYDVISLDYKLPIQPELDPVASRVIEMESELIRYTSDLNRLFQQQHVHEMCISGKVSVIIPTYNRAHLIGASIKSVLDQTYTNLEIIVVDDGSEDNTREVVSEFSDSRLRYVYQSNRGRSNARNHALSLATGKYIAFLDSDDLFLPDKIEHQVSYLRNHPGVGMVYTSAYCIDQKGEILDHKYLANVSGFIYESIAFFTRVTITLPTVMTYRSIMNLVGGFDEKMHRFEDTDMWRRISKVCRVDAMPEFTCYLRTHDDNHLINQNAQSIADAIDYYAKKILDEDDHIDPDVRRRGIAGLYRYYGYALSSVPSFSDVGKKLLQTAIEYDDLVHDKALLAQITQKIFRKIRLYRVRYWLSWGFRYVYYRLLNYSYLYYSGLRRRLGGKK